MSDETQQVPIRDEMIRLGQALKLANVVEDGVHARHVIEHGEVSVNGEVEVRRGRQLHPGDVISFGDERLQITADSDDADDTDD